MELLFDARTGKKAAITDWVAAFADLWQGGRDRLDDFMILFHPDIKLTAPGLRTTVGHRAGREAFRKTFEVFPDMRAAVGPWAVTQDALFVEMRFTATVGGRLVSWGGVDRFTIRNGAVVERVAFLNPLPVRRALLRNLSGWRQLMRMKRAGL